MTTMTRPTRHEVRRIRLLGAVAAAAIATWLGGARAARAQVPTVSPDGTLADPAAPPPQEPQQPTTVVVPAQGGAAQPGATDESAGGTGGYYYNDVEGNGSMESFFGQGEGEGGEGVLRVHNGAVPPVHTVRRGDTLWDISWFYFDSPWEWPKIWSYNPEITNPHWIYPGNQVRLYPAGKGPQPAAPTATTMQKTGPASRPATRPASTSAFELRQLAFVASENLRAPMKVVGSPAEKMLLASGDEVYLSYPGGHPPRVGQRFSVYQEKQKVKHPDSGKVVGAYVKIMGDVEVISVKQGKRARAVILDSVDAIERGMEVGPLKRQFMNVEPTPDKVNLRASIVAELSSEQLIGARQVVFLDRGSRQGLEVGNRLEVVRRGDAYASEMGPKANVGKDDTRYPARSIGEVMVVEVGRSSAVAVVTRSEQEFGIGDHVVMSASSK